MENNIDVFPELPEARNLAGADSAGHSIANTPTVCSFFCNDRNKALPSVTVLLQGLDAVEECNGKERARFLRDLGNYLEERSKSGNCSINLVPSSRTVIAGNLPGLKVLVSRVGIERGTARTCGYRYTQVRSGWLLCERPVSSRIDQNKIGWFFSIDISCPRRFAIMIIHQYCRSRKVYFRMYAGPLRRIH